MPSIVVNEYTDQVVRRTQETIHEIEEEGGSIEVWHEGVLVDKLTSYTGVEYALREAPDVAKRFRIAPSSSLHVRVRAERTRGLRAGPGELRYGHREYRETVGSDWTVLLRHVWDSHSGDLPEGLAISLPFAQSAFYAAPGERPEFVAGDGTAGMTVREIAWLPEHLLWEGWGFGGVTGVGMERIDLEARPAHIENERSLGSAGAWTEFRFTGAFEITVPAGVDPTRAVEVLREHGCEPRIAMTRRGWPEWTKGGHFYCGSPATVHSWGSDTERS